MQRRAHHKSAGCLSARRGVDNTFRCEPMPSAQLRHCSNFAKQEQIHRMYQEFETTNQRRLIHRSQNNLDRQPRYSARNSTHSNRPPTGIDLALGLNGFQRLTFDRPARTPTTLASNNDEIHDSRPPGRLVSSAGPRSKWEKAAKWERIEAEVNERKARDEEDRREAVRQAQEKQLEQESQELREERSRQLDKVVAKDWRYQVDLKEKREEQERLREFQDAHDLRRKIQMEQEMEMARLKQREREMEEIKRTDLTNYEERKFAEKVNEQRGQETELIQAAKKDLADKLAEEHIEHERAERQIQLRAEQLDQIERQRMRENHRAVVEQDTERSKNEENLRVQEAARREAEDKKKKELRSTHQFHEFLDNSAKQKKTEENFAKKYVEHDNREILKANYERAVRDEEERKRNRAVVGDFVRGQIQEREKQARTARLASEEAQAKRLEEEKRYLSTVQSEKERARKARENYRKCLENQVQERNYRKQLEERENEKFRLDQEAWESRKEEDINRRVRKMNLLESHITFG